MRKSETEIFDYGRDEDWDNKHIRKFLENDSQDVDETTIQRVICVEEPV